MQLEKQQQILVSAIMVSDFHLCQLGTAGLKNPSNPVRDVEAVTVDCSHLNLCLHHKNENLESVLGAESQDEKPEFS